MKQLNRSLQSVAKDLKALAQKVEKLSKRIEGDEKVEAVKKPRATSPKKPAIKKVKKVTATDTVLAIIEKSDKGVDVVTMKKRTGFQDNSVRAILSRLKKQGKIKSVKKGVYSKE